MYFVQWMGDTESDPLDHGTEAYGDYDDAKEFADRQGKKGLNATIYRGEILLMEYQTSVKEMRGN